MLPFTVAGQKVSKQNVQKPNIIFILTNDMGNDDISCFNGRYATPNIDRMAAEGRKFTNYYSASPITGCVNRLIF